MSLGDFDASAVIYGKFTTRRFSTGAPYALAGTPALSVYKDNSTTQSTTGVTLTTDFDTVTGLNHFAIDTSADGTFYSAGSFFDVVITTGTVDSVSVVGEVVASFTIRKNSALKPATAGRTLVVDAAGLADANTVKVGPSGSGTAQTAKDIGAAVPAAAAGASGGLLISGSNSGTTTLGALTVTGATTMTGGLTAAITGNITGNLSGSVGSVTGAVGSVTGNVGGNVVGSVASVTAGVTVTTNNDKTGYALTSGERTSVADAILDRDMSTGTDSGSTTVRTPRQALRAIRNKSAVAAGTLTVYKEDDATASWTAAVTGTAGADPITAIDPAGP